MLRWYRPDFVHEVTIRTIDGRWWFDPDNAPMRREMIGALAVAQRDTGVRVHAVTFMSNHYHGLFSADFAEQFSQFLCLFHAGLARIANRYWQRKGPIWDGPAAVIPVCGDSASQLQRAEYLLSQGVKAGAARHPRQWPGVSTTAWLLDGEPLVGVHRNQTAITLASRNGRDPGDLAAYTHDVTVELTPLPCFAEVPEADWRAELNQIADAIAERYVGSSQPSASEPAEPADTPCRVECGRFESIRSEMNIEAERVRTSAPPERRKLKRVHAANPADGRRYLEERKEFEEAYRQAAQQLREAAAKAGAGAEAQFVVFPNWCFPAPAPSAPSARATDTKHCYFGG